MAKEYCVIIGDIVQSKEIKNRRVFQRKFSGILRKINKEFASNVVSKFTITIGDEFQGVLKDLSQSYNIIDKIQEMFYPVKLRFGVGWGKITTSIKKEAVGMDGPAFHRAREAIEEAEKTKLGIIFKLNKLEENLSINTLVHCLENIKNSWTARQREVTALYLKYNNQEKVARLLKVKQPSVAAVLTSAQWNWYSEVREGVNTLLKLV
jgi:hypothetical protein